MSRVPHNAATFLERHFIRVATATDEPVSHQLLDVLEAALVAVFVVLDYLKVAGRHGRSVGGTNTDVRARSIVSSASVNFPTARTTASGSPTPAVWLIACLPRVCPWHSRERGSRIVRSGVGA